MSSEAGEGQRKDSVKWQVIAALRKGNCNVSGIDSYIPCNLTASQDKRLCQVRCASIVRTSSATLFLKISFIGSGDTIQIQKLFCLYCVVILQLFDLDGKIQRYLTNR